jgi:hypothetical protein
MAKASGGGASTKLYGSITRKECKEVILNNAKAGITTIVRGHNGWGKTALTKDLREALPKHRLVLCDMSTKEAGDLTMPKFASVDGNDVVRAIPHEDLGVHLGGDVILFIDEIFKAKKPLQVALAQLLYEHKIGGFQLSPDSIVCGASNLEDEGFGDQSLGFVYNRISIVEMAKPTADEWVDEYALANGIHPTIIQSAKEYPAMFNDFRMYSKPGDNQYIFDPRAPQSFYVTGRSLERASNVLFANENLPADRKNHVLTHLLMHCVGERAAADIMAVNELHAELPAWSDIIKNPEKTKVPASAGACCLLIYSAIQNIEDKTVDPWMVYLKRFKKEAQALFVSSILRVDSKSQIVATHNSFVDWAMENQYLYKAA